VIWGRDLRGRLHDGFMEWSRRAPERIAVATGDANVTYGELAGRAVVIARHLLTIGVGRNDRVAILIEKGPALYAAVLATMLAGAAYVPLAPKYPVARLKIILEDAGSKAVIHDDMGLAAAVIDGDDVIQIDIRPFFREIPGSSAADVGSFADNAPQDVAYVLFTSGSTGRPKGVMVRHANAVAFVEWAREYFQITADDRLAGHSDLTFDLSVFDTFVALSSGATLVPVVDAVDRTSPGHFIQRNGITVWFSVPAVLSGMQMRNEITAAYLSGLRWMIFCGEALAPGPVRSLRAAMSSLRIANLYGPTEATVACSAFEVGPVPSDADAIPIGWRTAGTEIFVWHEEGRTAALGEEGEIFIAGDQVALGYLNNPTETAERFVVDPRSPEAGTVCYRTGDVAEVRADGPVFKGRLDLQIKFRGWRIETGDVERELSVLDGVTESAVGVVRREGRPDVFVAFVRQSTDRTPSELLNLLKARIPDYMMPTHVRVIDDFPRTLNGKIDRKRLSELF
jgi:amino acid adenylation domain-containing protein